MIHLLPQLLGAMKGRSEGVQFKQSFLARNPMGSPSARSVADTGGNHLTRTEDGLKACSTLKTRGPAQAYRVQL